MNKKLVESYYAAWNTLDADNPASFYAKDAKLVFFDLTPLKYNGWAEYKEGVQKAFFDQISSGKLTPNDDLKITRRGDVAWMTLTFHLSFALKVGLTPPRRQWRSIAAIPRSERNFEANG